MISETLQEFSLLLGGIIILIIMYALIGSFFQHRHIHLIHETGVGIIIGFLFGVIMYFAHDLSQYDFNEELFFYALLPPMIFAGGYNLKKKKFFQNFLYIALYGVFGTFVCFGIVFGLTYLINELGYIRTWSNFQEHVDLDLSLIVKFSATICASDAVAALTIIKPHEYPKLFSIVFGQGLMNDAVAIILFKVVGDILSDDSTSSLASTVLTDDEQSTAGIIFGIIGGFLLNVVTSLAIGTAAALICTKIFQKLRFLADNPILEVVVIYLFGILSYVLAEVANMSGVITVLVCGIVLAHFNFYNLSMTGQVSTGVTFQSISFIAEAFVFIYLGLSTMYYVTEYEFSYTFVVLQLLICVFARFIALFGLSLLIRLCYKKWNVSMYELLIVTVAGVIRGSVAFALILTIENPEDNDTNKGVFIVKSSVLLMVFITTIFLGAIMPSFISCTLKRDSKNQNKGSMTETLLDEEKQKERSEKPRTFFKMFDQQYLKPFFIFNYRERKEEIKEFKKLLKLNSPEYKGGQYIVLMKANIKQSILQEKEAKGKKSMFTDGIQ